MPPRKAAKPAPRPELETLSFADQAAWEAWLERHHDGPGVWIRFAKKGSGVPSLTHDEALESALCFGWIDGQAASDEPPFWLQRFTPRRARSKWSQVNCAKVEALTAAGRMRPRGIAEVAAAKADGRWAAAYAPSSTIEVPEDLERRLDASPRARTAFAELDSRNRYAILYRLHDAKRPDTRSRRLEQFVTMLEEGRTLH